MNDIVSKNLLIIGNGFDLALKLKTSYKDFVNSSFWPLTNKDPQSLSDGSLEWDILSFTKDVKDRETGLVRWIDLEGIMYDYALRLKNENPTLTSNDIVNNANKNKVLLEQLKYSFSQYLRANVKVLIDLDRRGINKSLRTLITAIYKMDSSTKVYSFNYTDTASILTNIFNWPNPNVTHMHGRVTDLSSNIVLGVNDRNVVDKYHRFLLKSHQEGFVSTDLFNHLEKASTIIFYGLSFGANDMDYFKEYFKSLIQNSSQRTERVNICIFTWDQESVASIKSFFEDADVSIRDLYLKTNLFFFKVSNFGDCGEGDSELQSFLEFTEENTPVYFGGIM